MNKSLLWIPALLLSITSCTSVKQLSSTPYDPGAPVADAPPKLAPNSVVESKVTALSTSFTVPIVRFNRHVDPSLAADHSQGSVSLFNSIGAGLGFFTGKLTETTDANSRVVSTDMNNAFGVQVGVLFAANTEESNKQDIFALTGEISFLNFQVGAGYEFGHVVENQRRGFVTIAYGVPVSKLVKGGFYVLHSSNRAHPKPYFPE